MKCVESKKASRRYLFGLDSEPPRGAVAEQELLGLQVAPRRAMAYPVRHFDPETIYFLTARTIQSRLLMAPGDKANELIGGSLARAVRQCEIELFAYVFTSNHFHLMARAPSAIAMSKFMQRLQSNIAIKVGRLVEWRGRFFARRYSAEPIVDEAAQVERLGYILSHGVKEGLVKKVEDWPGLSCAKALVAGVASLPQTWRNWTRRWDMEVNEDIKIDRFSSDCPSETESLILTPLPCWSSHSPAERGRLAAQLIANINSTARNEGKVLGPAGVRAQDPLDRPLRTKHTPRPKAHASTKELWIAAVRRYRAVLAAFREASSQWLAGCFDVQFPLHCLRPAAWSVLTRNV